MRYLSIDCETTGLNHERCQILSLGVVIEDTNNLIPVGELPSFHCAVLHNEINGEPFALNMNKDLLSKIVEYQISDNKEEVKKKYNMLFLDEKDVVVELWKFLIRNKFIEFDMLDSFGENMTHDIKTNTTYPTITNKTPKTYITVAGKNFATFDKFFIERLPRWKQLFKIRQRIIDPGVLFVNWKDDEALPNLKTCMERANIEGEVTHNADDDAKDVIKILRTKY